MFQPDDMCRFQQPALARPASPQAVHLGPRRDESLRGGGRQEPLTGPADHHSRSATGGLLRTPAPREASPASELSALALPGRQPDDHLRHFTATVTPFVLDAPVVRDLVADLEVREDRPFRKCSSSSSSQSSFCTPARRGAQRCPRRVLPPASPRYPIVSPGRAYQAGVDEAVATPQREMRRSSPCTVGHWSSWTNRRPRPLPTSGSRSGSSRIGWLRSCSSRARHHVLASEPAPSCARRAGAPLTLRRATQRLYAAKGDADRYDRATAMT